MQTVLRGEYAWHFVLAFFAAGRGGGGTDGGGGTGFFASGFDFALLARYACFRSVSFAHFLGLPINGTLLLDAMSRLLS